MSHDHWHGGPPLLVTLQPSTRGNAPAPLGHPRTLEFLATLPPAPRKSSNDRPADSTNDDQGICCDYVGPRGHDGSLRANDRETSES
jgi:hypothetical protein